MKRHVDLLDMTTLQHAVLNVSAGL